MNCGNCGFWEPCYIKLGPHTNLGQCTSEENTLTPPVLKCVTGNWCPRPTIWDMTWTVGNMRMDIHNTKPGDKVICVEQMEDFWGADRGNTKECLVVGEQYTVEKVEIHSWHTNVFLEGYSGIPFNSVQFENVEESGKGA